MPIRFRCEYCNRLLGIARRKAGSQVKCPHCGYAITVPDPPAEDGTELMELEALLLSDFPKPTAVPQSEPAPNPAPSPSGSPVAGSEDPPLFERELDSIFRGLKTAPRLPDDRNEKSPPTSGMDAMSLAPEAGHVVLTPQKVTVLAVAAFLLVVLSFIAGYVAGGGK